MIAYIAAGVGKTLDNQVKPDLIEAHERVVANWETEVEFKARKVITKEYIAVDVFPAGDGAQIWKFVSGGTKKHDIVPKRANALRFVSGGKGSYKPKTLPGGKFGGPGVVSGGEVVYRKKVTHPGTKPRNFEKTIGEDYIKTYRRVCENAIRRAIRKYNQEIVTKEV